MYCLYFKQKNAYEMRISDWSSDVCSSDLVARHVVDERRDDDDVGLTLLAVGLCALTILLLIFTVSRDREIVLQPILRSPVTVSSAGVSREYLEMRSEERRVGIEGVSTCRFRWSLDH